MMLSSSSLLLILSNFIEVNAVMKLLESFQAGADFDEKNRWQLAKPHIKCSVCKLTVQEIVKLLPDSENLVDNRVYDEFDKICDADPVFNKYEMIEPASRTTNDWKIQTRGKDEKDKNYNDPQSSLPEIDKSDPQAVEEAAKKGEAPYQHGQGSLYLAMALLGYFGYSYIYLRIKDFLKDLYHKRKLLAKAIPRYWQTHAMKEVCLESVKAEDDDLVKSILKWKKKKQNKELRKVDEMTVENWCAKVKQCPKSKKGQGRAEL